MKNNLKKEGDIGEGSKLLKIAASHVYYLCSTCLSRGELDEWRTT